MTDATDAAALHCAALHCTTLRSSPQVLTDLVPASTTSSTTTSPVRIIAISSAPTNSSTAAASSRFAVLVNNGVFPNGVDGVLMYDLDNLPLDGKVLAAPEPLPSNGMKAGKTGCTGVKRIRCHLVKVQEEPLYNAADLVLSPNAKLLATTHYNTEDPSTGQRAYGIAVWNIGTGKLVAQTFAAPLSKEYLRGSAINTPVFSPDSTTLAWTTATGNYEPLTDDGAAYFWKLGRSCSDASPGSGCGSSTPHVVRVGPAWQAMGVQFLGSSTLVAVGACSWEVKKAGRWVRCPCLIDWVS